VAAIASSATPSIELIALQEPRAKRRRAMNSSRPVIAASHQTKVLAVGVCGGWSTVTVIVTVGLFAGVVGVLYMAWICPGEKMHRALAGRVEASQPNPINPFQLP
jgi:ABC-type enterobactin transport system permease subunit